MSQRSSSGGVAFHFKKPVCHKPHTRACAVISSPQPSPPCPLCFTLVVRLYTQHETKHALALLSIFVLPSTGFQIGQHRVNSATMLSSATCAAVLLSVVGIATTTPSMVKCVDYTDEANQKVRKKEKKKCQMATVSDCQRRFLFFPSCVSRTVCPPPPSPIYVLTRSQRLA